MSLATTLPAPDQSQRWSPLGEEQGVEAGNFKSRPSPAPFTNPPRNATSQRVVQHARQSLAKVLRRLFRKTDLQATGLLLSQLAETAICRKVFLDTRSNRLDDLMQFDELDPLPFVVDLVVDEENPGRKPNLDGSNRRATSSESSPANRACIAIEQREAMTGASPIPTFRRHESAPVFECRLLDVNMSGIAILAAQPFSRGSMLLVRIDTASSGRVIETSGTVVRCDPSIAGGFQVICRLEKYLQFAEIRDIGRDLFASSIV